jgi:DUF4097 and DUF4098 domain-containing protein YvlB
MTVGFHPIRLVSWSAALAWVVAAPLAAQQDDERWQRRCEQDYGDRDQERFCEVRQLGFRPTGRALEFEPDDNGGVEITGWDRDSVAISARIQAGARSHDAAVALAREVQIEIAGSTVRVNGPSTGRREQWGVILVVQVPRKSDLHAETTNGPLSVDGVSGDIELRATNGPVSLSGVSGDVRARVQNGPLNVVLNGSAWNGKGLDAEAVNGPVDLALPEDYNAELETGTVNGPTDFEIPITVTLHGRRPDRIRTTLGRGGASVRVVTTNGPITVRRARG